MADPRSTSTRRAVLSYSHLKSLTDWPDLLLNDYQGIYQDFVFVTDEMDIIDARVTTNEADIIELEDSHYPNMGAQIQFLQQQIDGLPVFTVDTSGFTTDTTFITADKVIA